MLLGQVQMHLFFSRHSGQYVFHQLGRLDWASFRVVSDFQ